MCKCYSSLWCARHEETKRKCLSIIIKFKMKIIIIIIVHWRYYVFYCVVLHHKRHNNTRICACLNQSHNNDNNDKKKSRTKTMYKWLSEFTNEKTPSNYFKTIVYAKLFSSTFGVCLLLFAINVAIWKWNVPLYCVDCTHLHHTHALFRLKTHRHTRKNFSLLWFYRFHHFSFHLNSPMKQCLNYFT